jgi:putative phosphoribosyl transferase
MHANSHGSSTMKSKDQLVRIAMGRIALEGNLAIPESALGVVLFAHGSGSSRHSPRNRRVAEALQEVGLATLLLDLLTSEEEAIDMRTAELRFDIDLLAGRLVQATDWLGEDERTRQLPLGYFGSSTGAGAALIAAAQRPRKVAAVVSRGGRPDLAGASLVEVRAPTLLIVGGRDAPVAGMNRQALEELQCEKRLEIVADATHLFEEPGALDQVARLARDWFVSHFQPAQNPVN